jgi:hypothetical protein
MAEESLRYSCPFINQYVRIPKHISDRVNAAHSAEYEGVRHCIGLIMVNLLALGEVAYSRNSNFYTKHHTRHYTRANMLKAVEVAAAQGYAVKSRMGFWNRKFERGLSSTLSPGGRLHGIEPPAEMELEIESLPLLVVDDRQVFDSEGLASIVSNPGLVSPESLSLTSRLTDIYHTASRLNKNYWNRMAVDGRNLGPGERCLSRVGLTRRYKEGGVGRWFQMGGLSYQQLPKVERAKLILDGDGVSELDYPAMHPHLLYAWEGRWCPDGFYESVTELCGCTRPVAKQMALMAVNADGYRKLVSAVNFGRWREPEPTLYDELKRLGLTPREVVQALVQAHPVLEKYIYSGQANRLMLEESEIMTSVLLSLMEVGIPALPVHDSVVAPRRDREQVRQAMEYAYRERTGFRIAVE